MGSRLKKVIFIPSLLFLLTSCYSQYRDNKNTTQKENKSLAIAPTEHSKEDVSPKKVFSEKEKQEIVEKFFRKFIDFKNVLSQELENQIQEFFSIDYQTIRTHYSNDLEQQYNMTLLWEYLYRLMLSEYYLVRIVGEKQVQRIQSLILGSPFYYGLGQIGNAFLDKPQNEPEFEPELFIHILSDIALSYKNLENLENKALKALRTAEICSRLDDAKLQKNAIIKSLIDISKEADLNQEEEESVQITDIETLRQSLKEFLVLIYKQKNMFFESLPISMLIFEKIKVNGKTITLSEKLIEDTLFARDLQSVRGWSEIETWRVITEKNWSIVQSLAKHRLDNLYDHGYHAVIRSGKYSQGVLFFIKYDLLRYQVLERLDRVGADELIQLDNELTHPKEGFINRFGKLVGLQVGAIMACRSIAAGLALSRGMISLAMVPIFSVAVAKGVADIESEEDELRIGASYGLNSQFAFYQLQERSRTRAIFDVATSVVFTGLWCMKPSVPGVNPQAVMARGGEGSSLILRILRRIAHPIKYTGKHGVPELKQGAWTLIAVSASIGVYSQAQSWIYSGHPLKGLFDWHFWRWMFINPDQRQSLVLLAGTEFIYMFRGLTAKSYIKGMQRASLEVFLYSSVIQGGRYLYYEGNLDNYDIGRNFFEATYIAVFSVWKATRLFVPIGMHANAKLFQMGYGSFIRNSTALGILTSSNYIGNSIYALTIDDAYNGRFYEMIDDLSNEHFEYENFIKKYSLSKDLHQAFDAEVLGLDLEGDHMIEHAEGDHHDRKAESLPFE